MITVSLVCAAHVAARRIAFRLPLGLVAGPLLVAGLLLAQPSLAANADVTVEVTPTTSSVSLARPGLQPLAAYDVLIRNRTNNVINQVVFDATANSAPFTYTTSGLCAAAGTGGNAVHCNIGQLRGASDAVGSVARFTLFFNAPVSGTKIDLDWTATFSSGNSPNAPPASFASFSGQTRTLLDPASKANSEINTALLPATATTTTTDYFTGDQAIATSSDVLTSRLTVPADLGQSTLRITEKTSKTNTSNFSSTNDVEIHLPPQAGTGSIYPSPTSLAVTVHVSQVRPKVNIANVVVLYAPDEHPDQLNPLATCDATYGIATAGQPICVKDRQVRSDGSFTILLSMLHNGFLGLR